MERIKILIRFDDICPTMNWEKWSLAEQILDEHGIKPLLGVIPDCKDPDLKIDRERPDFWCWLQMKQKSGYTIAMHGYNHLFCSNEHGILNYRMNSEYAGLSYQEQLDKIRKGKQILESHGIFTDIFFAPAHSYDENTVKALAESGFKYISDGKSKNAYIWHGIKFLPCRNPGSARIKRNGYYTSIYHAHEWIKKEKITEFKLLCGLIERYNCRIVNFDSYRDQPLGYTNIERISEKMYVQFERVLLPLLRKIKRIIE